MAETYVYRDGSRLTPYMLQQINKLDADYNKTFGYRILVSSGIRLAQEQIDIFLARYVKAADIRGRKVYDTRVWNGVIWYRISSAGTVATPGTSNHEIQGNKAAVDLRDSGPDAGVTVAGSKRSNWLRANCSKYGLVASGFSFGEAWHYDVLNIWGAGVSGSGGSPVSSSVKSNQTYLIQIGYDLGPSGADGIAGPKYKAAVKAYQTLLASFRYYTGAIDGEWGNGTQEAHKKYVSKIKSEQKWLNSIKIDVGAEDGIAGKKYVAGVKSYQKILTKYGYSGAIDGVWGPGVQAAHEKYKKAQAESKPSTSTAPKFPLPSGHWFGPEGGGPSSVSGWHGHKEDLMVWQKKIKSLGYDITVDGLYGPIGATKPTGNTADVAKKFQKDRGLTPDGLIGVSTWAEAWKKATTKPDPKPDPPEGPKTEDDFTPDLVSPDLSDFPVWIKFDKNLDPDGQKPNLNMEAATYYGAPYDPIESHLHWWGKPGEAGTHDGNVNYIKNTPDLSVNFVVSENRVTLMVPLHKIALTTGARNPFAWKSENDPTLTEQQYKTMGYLHYIVEKLNPKLRNEALRLHKEFYSTSCSEINVDKVREYADEFHSGVRDPKTGELASSIPEDSDTVTVKKSFLKNLANEFRNLAEDLEELSK